MKRLAGLLLFGVILAIILFNGERILSFSQAQGLRNAAKGALQTGNLEKALDIYEQGHRDFPKNTAVSLRLAWLYARAKEPQKAKDLYRDILKRHPDNLGARMGMAALLKTEPGQLNAAIDEYRKAVKAHPKDYRLMAALGDLYREAAANPQETRREIKVWLQNQSVYYYQQSLNRFPKQFRTRFNLGVVQQLLGNNKAAAQTYCQAILLEPTSFPARFNLGAVLSELNYYDEAYRQMDRSVALASDAGNRRVTEALARRVQQIKNDIYGNPGRKALKAPDTVGFLQEGCLERPANNDN